MYMSSRLAEVSRLTHCPPHMRADGRRDRVGTSLKMDVTSGRIARRATRGQESLRRQGRVDATTLLCPSHACYRRPQRENPERLRPCGLRSTLAAQPPRTSGTRLTRMLAWLGWASRPRARALLPSRVTSLQATMGGGAYGEHAEAAGRAAEVGRRHRARYQTVLGVGWERG